MLTFTVPVNQQPHEKQAKHCPEDKWHYRQQHSLISLPQTGIAGPQISHNQGCHRKQNIPEQYAVLLPRPGLYFLFVFLLFSGNPLILLILLDLIDRTASLPFLQFPEFCVVFFVALHICLNRFFLSFICKRQTLFYLHAL